MSESQMELKQQIKDDFEKFREQMPEMGRAYETMPQEVYKDGALSGKQKRLMALCVAVTSGCRGCILYQTDHALDNGAGAEEILEACGVAISMGGTMAAAEATRVVQYLREKGLVS